MTKIMTGSGHFVQTTGYQSLSGFEANTLPLRYAAKYDSYSLNIVANWGLTQGLPRWRHEFGIPFAALVFEMGIYV